MRFVAGLAALALPAAAVAQDSEDEVPQRDIILHHPTIETTIVVSGGLLTQDPGDFLMARSVIRLEDRNAGQRIENLLRDEAGLVQFRRSDGRSANPTSQGVTLRGLGGNAASRAIVLLDGVPQTDPFGGWVPWTSFDALSLGGIRVVRGGGSGIDGSGALGGTIALYTNNDTSPRAAIAVGSRGSYDLSARAGMETEGGRVALDARWSGADGFAPIVAGQRGAVDRSAPFQQGGGGLRAIIYPSDSDRIEVTVRGSYDRRDRGVDFTTSRVTSVDASVRYIVDPTPYDGWQASALVYLQLREFTTGFAAIAADRSSVAPTQAQRVPATGVGARFELRPAIGGENPLHFGVDWRRSSGTTIEDSNFLALVPRRNRRAGGQSDTLGLFAVLGDDNRDDWEHLNWSVSARIDRWWLSDGFRVERDIGGAIRSDDRFVGRSGWQPTARAALGWRMKDITLRGAAYRGWRLPTLNELYRPFRVGADATAANEALKPERFRGAEVGVDWNLAFGANLSLTAFTSRLSDSIANVTLGQGPGTFPGVGFVAAGGRYAQRQNLNAITANGIEATADFRMGQGLSLRATYAHTDARVRASGAAAVLDGQRPAQIAKDAASLSAAFDGEPIKANVTLRYIGAQNEDDLGQLRLRDALTMDARFAWSLTNQVTAELRGENLFDALVPAAISSGGIIERTYPRSVWVGLRASF